MAWEIRQINGCMAVGLTIDKSTRQPPGRNCAPGSGGRHLFSSHYLVSTGLNYCSYERLESSSSHKKMDIYPFPGTVIFLVAFGANPRPERALSVMYPLILNSWLINICTTNTISDRARLQRHRGKVVHESAGSGEGGREGPKTTGILGSYYPRGRLVDYTARRARE